MKKIFAILLFCLSFTFSGNSQNTEQMDDFGRIVISSYLDGSKTQIPASAFKILNNKLSQIASQNGIGGSFLQRFIITANVNVLTQDITPTAPPMHAYTLNVTFYIGDGIEGTLFSTLSMTAKGVGETPDKAYIAALKTIRVNDPSIAPFIEEGKNKIIQYYAANGEMYISKALTLADQEKFDDAILMLMNIPDVCSELYNKAMKEVAGVYQKKIDKDSQINLNNASAAWAKGLDAAAAEEAKAFLMKVHPKATCYPQATELISKIAARMKELDDREWARELRAEEMQHKENMNYINACKEVAVAQAKNQPKVVYNISWF